MTLSLHVLIQILSYINFTNQKDRKIEEKSNFNQEKIKIAQLVTDRLVSDELGDISLFCGNGYPVVLGKYGNYKIK